MPPVTKPAPSSAPEAEMKSLMIENDNAELSAAETSGRDSDDSGFAATDTFALEPAVNNFHPHVSLRVVVPGPDHGSIVYMVRASALAIASPVWHSQLQGRSLQTLELSDDAEAIRVIFHIAHHGYNEVPEAPTLDQLFELSKAACRYQCTHLFYPWASKWISTLFTVLEQGHSFGECHKAVYIAWTFGELELFRDMVDALVVSARTDADGNITNIQGERLDNLHLPQGLMEIITNARASTVTKILGGVAKPIDSISNRAEEDKNTYCRVGKDTKACEFIMLGSAIAMLTKAGLFPVPDAEGYRGSINDLKKSLTNAKSVPYCGKDWMPHLSHDHCTIGLDLVVMDCIKEMDICLPDSIMSHMLKQAQNCGVKLTAELENWQKTRHGQDAAEEANRIGPNERV